jgi:hypothetical protein
LNELKESYLDWTKNSPERFSFDMLVRKSNIAVIDYWEDIIAIIACNVDASKEVELRMDMLDLIEHLLS